MLRTGRGQLEVSVDGARAERTGRFARGDGWTRIGGEFTVDDRPGAPVTLAVRSQIGTGPSDLVAFDDLYVLPAAPGP
jgi:hypothetical protein